MNRRHLSNYYVWTSEKTRRIVSSLSDTEYTREIDPILGSVKEKVLHMTLSTLICFHHLKIEFKYLKDNPSQTIKHLNSLERVDFLRCWMLSDQLYAKLFKKEHTLPFWWVRVMIWSIFDKILNYFLIIVVNCGVCMISKQVVVIV